MKQSPIFTGVLGLNALLVALAAAAGAALVALGVDRILWMVLLAVAIAGLASLVNVLLLKRRFSPLEELIDEMEKADLSQPGANLPAWIDGRADSEEVERLELAFLRMMRRLEAERRRSASAALSAQEEERTRVARDLHDQVNQSLTGVLLRLEAVRSSAPPELEAEIDETKQLAHQAMDELLSVARQLRPTALDDLGLKAAIAGLAGQLERPGTTVEFSAEGDPAILGPDAQLVIYRVSQEALGNAIRHSGADRIEAILRISDEGAELTVSDNGSGFTFEQATSGLGLGGMRERALLVGGDLITESRPGRGTTVRLTVPAAFSESGSTERGEQ
ncbi:MAG: sensor histidine kinase [Solirubrobacterales bacterium]|nr:sensor histidine kinase [Solirubrobacterales bacterium]